MTMAGSAMTAPLLMSQVPVIISFNPMQSSIVTSVAWMKMLQL